MTPESLPAVVGIEKLSHGRPWSETSFLAELDNPYSILNLLWHGSALAGYICYHILLPELFILNLTTAPSYRRRGGARFLLNAAIASGVEKQVSRMSLEVRESNQAAISLYSACGFHCLARRKRFYSDGEDALVMERFLS